MEVPRVTVARSLAVFIAVLLAPSVLYADRHARRPRAPQAPPAAVPKAGAPELPATERAAPSGTLGPSPPRCQAIARQGYHTTQLRSCPVRILTRIDAWQPDALIALGGGTLPNGEPGCASEQRAWTAASVFERLGRRPTVILSGAGDAVPARALTAATRRCALVRRERELLAHGAPDAPGAQRLVREIAQLRRAHRASLTEAEYMCATVLGAYPERDWDEILGHLVLEPHSANTVQNVARTTPILTAGDFARVMVVSTPTYRFGRGVENHAYRAWELFRRRRPSDAHFRVGAIACPFGNGGPTWSAFE